MDIVIREAVADDLEPLIRLHDLFMAHHAARDDRFALRPGAPDAWYERIAAAVADPDVLVLLAEADHAPVGCAYTLIRPGALDFGPVRIGYLCDVFVAPACRRRGIARRFLASTRTWLLGRGIQTIEASWAVASDEARLTWPDLGFVPLSVSGRLDF